METTIKWNLKSGHEVELTCRYELIHLEEKLIDGGFGGKREESITETKRMNINIDGKRQGGADMMHLGKVKDMRDGDAKDAMIKADYEYVIDAMDVTLGLPTEKYEEIMAAFENMKEEAIKEKSEERIDVEGNMESKMEGKTKSEDTPLKMPYADRKKKEREYDNMYNEGGEGYNPYR